jgi:hypothetical protein
LVGESEKFIACSCHRTLELGNELSVEGVVSSAERVQSCLACGRRILSRASCRRCESASIPGVYRVRGQQNASRERLRPRGREPFDLLVFSGGASHTRARRKNGSNGPEKLLGHSESVGEAD